MTRVAADWLAAPGAQAVCALLESAGYQVFFVGGCVRNALLDETATDVDIATDARPDVVMDLARAADIHVIPTGIDHGTVTLVLDAVPYEVTTFRRDVATDGRRAVVAFSDDLAQDARRRDFTMNALYADARGMVTDPLGGLPDIMARRVRFIEDPAQRIREDYLRILRFFRFFAWYGGTDLDAEGLAACSELQEGLGQISIERVTAEVLKILTAPDPTPAVAAMARAGILARILPGSDPQALGPLVHFEGEFGLGPDPILRLSCLGGQPGLRLSKAQDRRLARLSDLARQALPAQELGYHLGVDDGGKAALLTAALLETLPDQDVLQMAAAGAAEVLPLRAADLAPYLSGPALGDALRAAEAAWIASRFTLTRDELLDGYPPA